MAEHRVRRPPGITRVRTARGFDYLDATGRPAPAADRQRIIALHIPPAWTDVWISPDPGAPLQAVGVDSRGRAQYRYAPWFLSQHARTKFSHVLEFGARFPDLRARVAAHLRGRGEPGYDRVLATAVRLLDRGFFRVGGEEYARDNQTYGLATLRREHVQVGPAGRLRFDYVAKHHKHRITEVVDLPAARVVGELVERSDPGPELLAWREPDGTWIDVRSAHVNGYIHHHVSVPATAKAFRVWAGTVIAASALAAGDLGGRFRSERGRKRQLSAAVKATSDLLGNTPAVARASYIHPGVIEAWNDGQTVADTVAAAGTDALHRLWLAPTVQAAVHDLLAARPAG